jgi:hypothetical protein
LCIEQINTSTAEITPNDATERPPKRACDPAQIGVSIVEPRRRAVSVDADGRFALRPPGRVCRGRTGSWRSNITPEWNDVEPDP